MSGVLGVCLPIASVTSDKLFGACSIPTSEARTGTRLYRPLHGSGSGQEHRDPDISLSEMPTRCARFRCWR